MITCESQSFYDDVAESVGIEVGQRRERQALVQLLGNLEETLSGHPSLGRRYISVNQIDTHKWVHRNVKVQHCHMLAVHRNVKVQHCHTLA